MTAINKELFTRTSFDSAAIGVLSSLVHVFDSPGVYHAVVCRSDIVVAGFDLVVDENSHENRLLVNLGLRRGGAIRGGLPGSGQLRRNL